MDPSTSVRKTSKYEFSRFFSDDSHEGWMKGGTMVAWSKISTILQRSFAMAFLGFKLCGVPLQPELLERSAKESVSKGNHKMISNLQ